MSVDLPDADAYVFSLALYPRSAKVLADLLDFDIAHATFDEQPLYVQIDMENLRNELLAHLQRVAAGE